MYGSQIYSEVALLLSSPSIASNTITLQHTYQCAFLSQLYDFFRFVFFAKSQNSSHRVELLSWLLYRILYPANKPSSSLVEPRDCPVYMTVESGTCQSKHSYLHWKESKEILYDVIDLKRLCFSVCGVLIKLYEFKEVKNWKPVYFNLIVQD